MINFLHKCTKQEFQDLYNLLKNESNDLLIFRKIMNLNNSYYSQSSKEDRTYYSNYQLLQYYSSFYGTFIPFS